WGRAAAAVPPPGAPDSFEEAYDEALSGLSDVSTAQQTATSLRRGLLPQSMKPAVQAENVAQLRLNMEITRLRMAWDIMCTTGPLGFAYNLPATGFDTAGLASGVFSLHRRIGPLLQAAVAVGAGAPRVPSARPEEATFTFGV